jgi:hypothetical protein
VPRVSEHYSLGLTQPSLPFVDVELTEDLAVFVDPRALVLDMTDRGRVAVSLVQDFFQRVLSLIGGGDHAGARALLGELREPNETRLGLSEGRPRGRALGQASAATVWDALRRSEAVKTGLLEDLEDTILMVEGISYDIVSDITTNLIRQPLIEFTQDVAAEFQIPTFQVDSGPLWDPKTSTWTSRLVNLPAPDGKLLLVPKEYVRRKMDYDVDEYYRHFLLSYMQDVELSNPNSSLVEVLKDGRRRVTKKRLQEEYGTGKAAIVKLTRQHPEIIENYRRAKGLRVKPPLAHEELAERTGTELPDWDKLLDDVTSIPAGAKNATRYHLATQALLTALFYPALTSPRHEWRIHDGRKRIDIVFTNYAQHGFFWWAAQHYIAPLIIVECKNYADDVANAELDQLAGRFGPNRSQVGLLLTRSFDDKDKFIQRCRDTATDNRGFVVPLDDSDLAKLVKERRTAARPSFQLLHDRFDKLIT